MQVSSENQPKPVNSQFSLPPFSKTPRSSNTSSTSCAARCAKIALGILLIGAAAAVIIPVTPLIGKIGIVIGGTVFLTVLLIRMIWLSCMKPPKLQEMKPEDLLDKVKEEVDRVSHAIEHGHPVPLNLAEKLISSLAESSRKIDELPKGGVEKEDSIYSQLTTYKQLIDLAIDEGSDPRSKMDRLSFHYRKYQQDQQVEEAQIQKEILREMDHLFLLEPELKQKCLLRVREFFTTEMDFLHDLEILDAHNWKLQNQKKKGTFLDKLEEKGLISHQERRDIHEGLKFLRKDRVNFFKSLGMNKGENPALFIQCLFQKDPDFILQQYITFFSSQHLSPVFEGCKIYLKADLTKDKKSLLVEVLSNEKGNKTKRKFQKKNQSQFIKQNQSQSIYAYLMTPVQRVAKYHLLLSDFSKNFKDKSELLSQLLDERQIEFGRLANQVNQIVPI